MKSLINRITKWLNDVDEADVFSYFVTLLIIVVIILFIFNMINAKKLPSKDEICQKHFGKDYVWHSGYKSPDFCVDNSGIPKYPKSWKE